MAEVAAQAPLEAALAALGPFGFYQRYTLVMLCLPNLLAAIYSLNYVFVADQVPYRCAVPECEGVPEPGAAGHYQYHNETVWALLPPDDSCRRYTPLALASSCERGDFHPTHTDLCRHFVYDNMDTTYAEFNLACREWMRTLVGTVRNSALPFALILTGFLSDRFGRRTALCVFGACAGVLGIVKAFSVNYEMYLAMEFLEAALGYGFNSAAYVMMLELARPSLRATFACATGVAYGAGGVLLAWLAWRVRYWRHLLLTAHLLALLLPLYWRLLDESVRYLHARGKLPDAERVIRKAARWNKILLDEELISSLYKSRDEADGRKSAEVDENPWLGLVRSRVLMARMALCSWCWIAAAFVYYGLTINSVSLSGDKYVNFALNMAMEIVASLLLMMALERIGRKWSILCAFLLCGLACVTPFVVSNEEVTFGMYFVGKLSITFAFNSLYVYTAEVFPTRVRSSALAACSLVGRLGSILAPQTPLLSGGVQAALYGASCALAALAVLRAPESRRAALPADTRAAETLGPAAPAPAPPAAPAPPLCRVLSADT